LQSPGGFRLRLRSYYGLPKPHLWGGHPGRVRLGWVRPPSHGRKCDFRTRPSFAEFTYTQIWK
jgi:hypothetical protein